MSAESNAEAARRVIDAFNTGDMSGIDECCSSDWVSHDPAETEDIVGIDAHKARVEGYRTAMSDLRVTVEDLFATDDRVATRWRAQGTNDGELMGMPASGNRVEITGNSIDRFEDGKIVETWDQWDNAGFMQQLGIGAEAMAEAG
jgi:steroid delta-isomerase-like uncharacterized protein